MQIIERPGLGANPVSTSTYRRAINQLRQKYKVFVEVDISSKNSGEPFEYLMSEYRPTDTWGYVSYPYAVYQRNQTSFTLLRRNILIFGFLDRQLALQFKLRQC